jgi:hypothetical protein
MGNLIYINELEQNQIEKYYNLGVEVKTPKEIWDILPNLTHDIIIQCELRIDEKGNGKVASDWYGIKFIQKLRQKNYSGRVLFISHVSEETVLKHFNNAIVGFLGHGFLHQEFVPDEWQTAMTEIIKLDQLALYDMQRHFCTDVDILNEKIHVLRSKITHKPEIDQDDADECLNLIKSVYDSQQIRYPTEYEIEIRRIKQGDELIEKVKSLCLDLIPYATQARHKQPLQSEWSRWKVLWLDDDENTIKPIIEILKVCLQSTDNYDERIILCKTYLEAKSMWDADEASGEISVVIADYRLKEEGINSRSKQGYQFLQEIAEKKLGVGLIGYSALTRRYLFETFKHFGIQLDIYSKIDFDSKIYDQALYIADQIVLLGDKHWLLRNNQPSGEEWKKMSETYFEYKDDPEFYSYEKFVSFKAQNILDDFIRQYQQCITKESIWNLKISDKNKINLRLSEFPKGDIEKRNALKDILLVRRVAIGIYAFLKQKRIVNYNLLINDAVFTFLKVFLHHASDSKKNEKIPNEIFEKKESQMIAYFKNHYKQIPRLHALTLETSWPLGLLPEEYAWLRFDSGLKIDYQSDISEYFKILNKIKSGIRKLFTDNAFFDLLIKENKVIIWFSKSNTPKETIIFFSQTKEPYIRTVEEIKILIHFLYEQLKVSEKKEKDYGDFIKLWRTILYIIKKSNLNQITSSLTFFLKELKPLKNDTIATLESIRDVEINNKRYTIEQEYMMDFAPWEYYFKLNSRIRPSNSEKIDKFRISCNKALHGTLKEKNDLQNHKSQLYYMAITKLGSMEAELYNIHPFSYILNIDTTTTESLNKKVFICIANSKIEYSKRIKELFLRIKNASRNSDVNNLGGWDEEKNDDIPETIQNHFINIGLDISIMNVRYYMNLEKLKDYNMDLKPEYENFKNFFIFVSHDDKDNIIEEPENLSNDENFIVLGFM